MAGYWIDGKPSDVLPAGNRAVLFGDSSFTTLAVRSGVPELWSRHRQRLQQADAVLKLGTDFDALEAELLEFCAPLARAIVRVTLIRAGDGRGYALPAARASNRLLMQREWPADIEARAETGIAVRWCSTPLAAQPLLAGLKHGNRLEQVLARAEWPSAGSERNTFAEGLMLDYQGNVIEATSSNLFFRHRDGHWCTPALTEAGIAGVRRAQLLDWFASEGLAVEIGVFSKATVAQASEGFLCNSVIGIWPIASLAGQAWQIGDDTRRAQQALARSNSL